MDEAYRAGKAFDKMQEVFSKYSNEINDVDELGQSLIDRINASEELLKLLQDADNAMRGVDSQEGGTQGVVGASGCRILKRSGGNATDTSIANKPLMYGVRPARYSLDQIVAECANAIRDCKSTAPTPKIVWSCAEGRWVINPEALQLKNGKLQEV